MRRFNIVQSRDDGSFEVHPMKEWLRQHPDFIPDGLNPTLSTSHQLREGLRKRGWHVQELPDEVRLFEPGSGDAMRTAAAVLGSSEDSEDSDDIESAFGLEHQLRDFIAQNLDSIDVNGKKLQLYVDNTGRDGTEYPTAVGPIDILAIDDGGSFYVFELKRARSPDRAIGQLARYMGWVRQTIGRDHDVHGIIVAKEIGRNLRYAVTVMPNVELFEYAVEFHLRAVDGVNEST